MRPAGNRNTVSHLIKRNGTKDVAMDAELNERMLEQRLRQLQAEVRFMQNFQIAMLRFLHLRWPSALDEMEQISQQLSEQARAEGLLDDARALDALIDQLDQNFGLPAND